MANKEHLAILKQGSSVWDNWRYKNPETWPDLTGANLRGAALASASLGYVNLRSADLSSADLGGAVFMCTSLDGADLSGANLSEASLYMANLYEARLSRANLSEANFSEADLAGADLSETNLCGANLTNAILTDARIRHTAFVDVDLSQVSDLASMVHQSLSSIGVDTLALTLRGSGGRFTEEQLVFFENAGVPSTMLEYLPGIMEANPLQFYTCVISYSTQDEDFADRLNHDLNESGIKTWKWDRDAVRGRDLAQNICQAIPTHDKTILVCSVNSLDSPQVEREIQQALDKEVQIKTANAERKKEAQARGEPAPTGDADVLIPVRLDNTIFNWDSYLRTEVTRRMVADFTDAPLSGDKYNRELQQLIQALNPQSWPSTVIAR